MQHISSVNYQQLDDLSLLSAVLDQDELAWQELLRRFRGLIFRCSSKILGRYESVLSNETLNDVFSEVCVNLLRNNMKKLRVYDPQRGSKLGGHKHWVAHD